MYDIIIWLSDIHFIGGVETVVYSFCQRFSKSYNILVLYVNGQPDQVSRISSVSNIELYDKNRTYQCNVLLLESFWNTNPTTITSNKTYQIIHADLDVLNMKVPTRPNLKIDGFISVSETSKIGLLKSNNIDSIVLGNFLPDKKEVKKILHLISCTRTSKEKGYNRMLQLVGILRGAKIRFDWKIFGDVEFYGCHRLNYPEVIHMPPDLDVMDYIVDADYGVQLSDHESFSCFVHECLQYNVPALVTDISAFKTMITNGVNGYKFNLDMSNVDPEQIYNNIPKFITLPDYDVEKQWIDWIEFLRGSRKVYGL